jgi:hypothetical protein
MSKINANRWLITETLIANVRGMLRSYICVLNINQNSRVQVISTFVTFLIVLSKQVCIYAENKY